ncbi:MAG: sensor histidine kinase [Candidatus Heteroscillospira sp.]
MNDTLKNLDSLFRMSAVPTAAIDGDVFVYCNPAAEKAFSGELTGSKPSELFPSWPYSRNCVAATNVLGVECIVTVTGFEELLVLTLAPTASADQAPSIPISALNSMASTITTLRMAADKLSVLCPKSEKQELYTSILYHNYYKLLRTTEHLTTLSSLRSNEYPFSPEPLELGTFLSDIASSVRSLTADSGVTLEYEPPADLITANGDASLLERLVLGLIANSLKHTPAGGRITLRVSKHRDSAMLSVDDTGAGIPPEILSSAFNISEAQTPAELSSCESGLGLPLVLAIASKHGGTLLLESREGIGTSARVLLRSVDESITTLRMPRAVYGSQIPVRALTELSTVLPRSQYAPNVVFDEKPDNN